MYYHNRAIILASDGLWNFIRASDCAEVLSSFIENDTTSTASHEQNHQHQNNRSCPSSSSASPSQSSSRSKQSITTATSTNNTMINGNHHNQHTGQQPIDPSRISKVYWANEHIENYNFLFTLDSHTAVAPLNAFTGFMAITTAAANVAIGIVSTLGPPTGCSGRCSEDHDDVDRMGISSVNDVTVIAPPDDHIPEGALHGTTPMSTTRVLCNMNCDESKLEGMLHCHNPCSYFPHPRCIPPPPPPPHPSPTYTLAHPSHHSF